MDGADTTHDINEKTVEAAAGGGRSEPIDNAQGGGETRHKASDGSGVGLRWLTCLVSDCIECM